MNVFKNPHKRDKNPVRCSSAARTRSTIILAETIKNLFYEQIKTSLRTGRTQRYNFCVCPKRKISKRSKTVFNNDTGSFRTVPLDARRTGSKSSNGKHGYLLDACLACIRR